MAAPADISFERRMLIDGKLVEAASGKTFANVNPATEEVIGEVTDATAADMHRAIDAARRAFDESRLVDEPRLQKALPGAASGGARGRAGGTARGADPRGRVSADGDARTPARRAAGRRAHPSRQADRRVSLGGRPRRGGVRPHRPADRKAHLARTGRRRRRHRAMELSVRGFDPQARSGPRHRQHHRAQARTRHPLQRHPHRAPGGGTYRHPRRAWSTSSPPPTT